MTQWLDTQRGRERRERSAPGPVPDQAPLLDADHAALLRRWLRGDHARRGRSVLLQEAGPLGIERAEALCDLLLHGGWIARRERLVGGSWQWEAIVWRDLPRLQALLGVESRRQREGERQSRLDDAAAWLQKRRAATAAAAVDPDLLDELTRALELLRNDKALRLDLLKVRLQLLQAVANWHDMGAQGSRRDFALRARDGTKSVGDADWRWLETSFDLERLRIARFAPVAWLAGDLLLHWGEQRMHLGSLHFVALPMADLRRSSAAHGVTRWWLIENRASFERQAEAREPGTLVAWMPGRPSNAWLEGIAHLLDLAPAPAWISADADPAGVDIACTAGALWTRRGLAWQAHQMEAAQLTSAAQYWPLNEHDHRLLAALMARPDLPAQLRELCQAMLAQGRKAEQEAWV